jgi:hypothetical protein
MRRAGWASGVEADAADAARRLVALSDDLDVLGIDLRSGLNVSVFRRRWDYARVELLAARPDVDEQRELIKASLMRPDRRVLSLTLLGTALRELPACVDLHLCGFRLLEREGIDDALGLAATKAAREQVTALALLLQDGPSLKWGRDQVKVEQTIDRLHRRFESAVLPLLDSAGSLIADGPPTGT